jgi:hypothetical protein
MSGNTYQSRDRHAFRCDCGSEFFSNVFQIDRDGIRITDVRKGDLLFYCPQCHRVFEIQTRYDQAPIKVVWNPKV